MINRIEQIKAYLGTKPGDPMLTHALALEYIKTGEDQKAREIFETLLNQQPDYVGSYYHLAGLIARLEETDTAIAWYEKGIAVAKKTGDTHALRELQNALNELLF